MKLYIERRVREAGQYILDTRATIRETAKFLKTSKSTIHKDIEIRLKEIDTECYNRVSEILRNNFEKKHINGGISTKKKWEATQKLRE